MFTKEGVVTRHRWETVGISGVFRANQIFWSIKSVSDCINRRHTIADINAANAAPWLNIYEDKLAGLNEKQSSTCLKPKTPFKKWRQTLNKIQEDNKISHQISAPSTLHESSLSTLQSRSPSCVPYWLSTTHVQSSLDLTGCPRVPHPSPAGQ